MSVFLKLWRDVRANSGRVTTLVFALVIGATALLAMLGTFGVLKREMQNAYVASTPASATLELDEVSEELVREVEARPDVAVATRRRTLHARYRTTTRGEWRSALVFIADDFANLPLATLGYERGSRSPTADGVLIERSALSLLGGDIGTRLSLKLPGEREVEVDITGVVHEVALAPAKTHETLYLYGGPALMARLGVAPTFDELRILVANGANDRAAIEEKAVEIGRWIREAGYGEVHEIRVPPPGDHPHQNQMTAVLAFLLAFSVAIFLMSCLLSASIIASLMARQTREIAILKTLGATSRGLVVAYSLGILALSALAALLATIPGAFAIRAFSGSVAGILNFDLDSLVPPPWIIVTFVIVTLAAPLLIALRDVLRGTGVSVQEALLDFGLGARVTTPREGVVYRALTKLFSTRLEFAYPLRNIFRQRARLILSISLLAASGGITVAAVSLADAWDSWGTRLRAEQKYDVEVFFARGFPVDDARKRLEALGAVDEIESWSSAATSIVKSGSFPVRNTYPDDAHGAFRVVAPPIGTQMFRVPIREGRWFSENADAEIVLNQVVPGQAKIPLGSSLALAFEGKEKTFVVVGKVEQVGVGASAYVNGRVLSQVLGAGALENSLKIRGDSSLRARVDEILMKGRFPVVEVIPLEIYKNAMVAHFEVLIRVLFAFAALTSIVGALGLGSAMSIGTVLRTREFGVLKAIGASEAQIRRLVIFEGGMVGGLSIGLAVLLALLIATSLGNLVGKMSFALPLPLTPSYSTALFWSVGVVIVAAFASYFPARASAKLTVREAVAHV